MDNGSFSQLAAGRHTLLTTYRRDGSPVATVVHLVAEDDGQVAYFRTWNTAGKAKRLRHTSQVEVTPSTSRGRATGPPLSAVAEPADDDQAARAAGLLAKKHPVLQGVLIPRFHRLRGWKTVHYVLSAVGQEDGASPGDTS
jgi:uncharacterized protein